MPDANPIISISNADIYRGEKRVLKNFSLAIDAGVDTAIVGPNGAGKTTLLKLFARELYPSRGDVSIFGESHWNIWELRKKFGVVSTDLQQNFRPHTPGRSVVLSGFFSSLNTFGHQTFSDDQIQIAEKVSSDLGIQDFFDTPFFKMSTGEQRRHLLARSLVHDPSVLVLDEPTNGLDLQAQFQFFETASRLIDSGKTIVLVTHHLHEIPQEVSRLVLLKRGTILVDGPKEEVLTSKNLSELYEVPVRVSVSGGYFHATPGE